MYSKTSPYATTKIVDGYLGMMVNRSIPKLKADKIFQINQIYNLRPDLLAYDLYKSSDLWWVFAQRNPNILKDPLYDFKVGTVIFLPTFETIKTALSF